jgi:multiple sugar transport system ATP-binding protein
MASVHIQNLDIVLGGNTILKSMNLAVQEGEFLVLLGPSGCGKSTLLHSIAGFYDVADGQILIGDKDVTWADPKDRDIGMVFQSYALYPTMNVERNMSFGLRVAGVDKAEIERRVQRAADMLHLTPLLGRKPSQLSGGQRQRVAIGRALVRDAKVFLFDEPLSNLDAQLRTELRRELKQLHQQIQATMIYVTHDQVEAMTLADRIAVMKAGVIQQIGTPDEIYHRPVNLFVAGFLGSPNMNLLRGRVGVVDGVPHFVGDALSLPLNQRPSFAGLTEGREVVLGVRPEQVVLQNTRGERAPYTGRITLVEPLGAQHIVWLAVNQTTALSVVVDSDWHGQVGEEVYWGVTPERVSLFDAASEQRI